MTSNGITITSSHSYNAGKVTWGWVGGDSVGKAMMMAVQPKHLYSPAGQ